MHESDQTLDVCRALNCGCRTFTRGRRSGYYETCADCHHTESVHRALTGKLTPKSPR